MSRKEGKKGRKKNNLTTVCRKNREKKDMRIKKAAARIFSHRELLSTNTHTFGESPADRRGIQEETGLDFRGRGFEPNPGRKLV